MKALSYTAFGGLATFVVTVTALHVVEPQLNPWHEAVSYYVHGAFGWLLTVGLIGLGGASLALLPGLTRAVPGARAGRWLLGVWGVGVLVGAIFPADPPGRWNEPPSLAGMIHGSVALLAFVAFPVAALLLARALARRAEWRSSSRLVSGLAVAATISLVLFMASLLPVFVRPGPPILLGASERLLLIAYVGWLAVVGAGLRRDSGMVKPQ